MNDEIEDKLRSTQPAGGSHDLRARVLANAGANWEDRETEESLRKCFFLKPSNELRNITLERARKEWKQSSHSVVSIRWLLGTAAALAFAFIGSWYDSHQNQKLDGILNAPPTTADVQADQPQPILPSTEVTPGIKILVGTGLLTNSEKGPRDITWFAMRNHYEGSSL